MKLMINHQTHYQYTETAKNSIQYIRMSPQSNEHQKVISWALSVPGEKVQALDAFNNIWITSTQRYDYQNLSIMAQGVVEINPDSQTGIKSDIPTAFFLQVTPTTMADAEMKAFAAELVENKDRADLIKLSEALIEKMPYVSFTTEVSTTAIDAFHHARGVCQDHAHVFIAMCRSLGIPARYVSGYLHVPNGNHLASHAWAEAFIDQEWYCFDVSNQLYTPSSHIYVAIGRDYWDVAPVRGVRQLGGIEEMNSIVQVLPC
jgi:transglutaminase-like putative cysteine protease